MARGGGAGECVGVGASKGQIAMVKKVLLVISKCSWKLSAE
jgi:hypothetical protein